MSLIRRYLTGFRGVDTSEPGLFEKDDGTSWYRKPDGSEAEIGSGGSQPVLAAAKELSSADILALDTIPITLIEGVPGKLITPLLAMAVFRYGTHVYASDSGSRFFIGPDYASSGWAAFSAGVWQSDAFDSAETYDVAANWQSNEQALSIMDGQPLRLDNSTPVTAGDGTQTVTVLYYLLDVT